MKAMSKISIFSFQHLHVDRIEKESLSCLLLQNQKKQIHLHVRRKAKKMKETRKVCYNMILFNSLLSFACYFGVDLFLYRSDFLYAFGLSLLLVSLPLFFFLVDYITDRIVYR